MLHRVLAFLLLQQTLALSTISKDQVNGTKQAPLTVPAASAAPTAPTAPTATPPLRNRKSSMRSRTTLANRFDVVMRSFMVVSVAEIFDKTWFVALICALNYGKRISFAGGFLALALHVFLAAALGVAISQFFSIQALCFSTAAVFFILALAYASEFVTAEANDDVIAERSLEAKEALQGEKEADWRDAFFRVFVAVFIAEWGDRTQVAMITLHSSAPWLPVCLGSLVAFFLLTFSAVAAATLVQHAKLSERFVLAVSALSFLLFAALALRDGFLAKAASQYA